MHPGDVDLERRDGAAVARDLLGREVGDRVAAVEGDAQFPASCAVEHLEPEGRMGEAGREVPHGAVREIVDADHLVPFSQEAIAEMGADEAGRPGDAYFLHEFLPVER